MARRTFFSFHYDNDVWRANVVRNCNVVLGCDTAGFFDHSEYEEAKRFGAAGIRRMIDRHLSNTSVTVVLIGEETASRPWVRYEIEQSIARGNGLVGVHINLIKDHQGRISSAGPEPYAHGEVFPVMTWLPSMHNFSVIQLAAQIEQAGQRGTINVVRRAMGY